MLTKELLLAKGLSPTEADEIIAAAGESQDENSLVALKKALEPKSSLFKADEDEEEEEEEEEEKKDKEYMKKSRKAADDAEKCASSLTKAVESIDPAADGAIVEMADLAPVLESIVESNTAMLKAITSLVESNERITRQSEKSFEILHKAAAVTAETAESISGYMDAPQGRKGVQTSDLSKAGKGGLDPKTVYIALAKAMQAGDTKAGSILEVFESSGKNIRALNAQRQAYVAELLKKEAN